LDYRRYGRRGSIRIARHRMQAAYFANRRMTPIASAIA
jgi:hypothetical protein